VAKFIKSINLVGSPGLVKVGVSSFPGHSPQKRSYRTKGCVGVVNVVNVFYQTPRVRRETARGGRSIAKTPTWPNRFTTFTTSK
jgi:hypothetical protein